MSTTKNKALSNSISFWSTVFVLILLSVGTITFILISDDLNPLKGSANNGDSGNTVVIQKPEIRVTSPAGGSVWLAGSRQTIAWQSYGLIGTVTIVLINNTCEEKSCKAVPTRQYIIADKISVYDASYGWDIPKNFPVGLYNLEIHSNNGFIFDSADGPIQVSK